MKTLQKLLRHDVLGEDEIRDLIGKAQAGDLDARNRIVQHNMRLVFSVARKFSGLPVKEDLISEGVFGLIQAIERFDPDRDCRFSTYATWWVQCYLRRNLKNDVTVRIPEYLQLIYCRWVSRWDGHSAPTVENIVAVTGCSVSQAGSVRSLLSPERRDRNRTIDRSPGPLQTLLADESAARVDAALDRLPDPRLRVILRARFGLDTGERQTLKEIGRGLGCTRERVRQLQVKAMDLMQELLS